MQLQMSCNKGKYRYPIGMDAQSPDLSADSPSKAAPSPVPDGSGWRAERGEPSLAGMFASVRTAKQGPFWRKLLAFLGPGYLVAVGYMDPGNWATSLAGGSQICAAPPTVALLFQPHGSLSQAPLYPA